MPDQAHHRRRAELVSAIERELDRTGRGPAKTLVDPLGRLAVYDASRALVAVVGEWAAEYRPGLVTLARRPDGTRWTAAS